MRINRASSVSPGDRVRYQHNLDLEGTVLSVEGENVSVKWDGVDQGDHQAVRSGVITTLCFDNLYSEARTVPFG